MDRQVDRFLRNEILAIMPLHPNENAYQAGKSVEKSLHQLMVQVEMVLDLQETALDVFLNIEGAFNNISMIPCVLLFLNMRLTTPSNSGLELPGGLHGCGNSQWIFQECCGI